jgi:hypothetical protein
MSWERMEWGEAIGFQRRHQRYDEETEGFEH